MTPRPDFDFGFGKDRYLRGYGWRGIIALALFLAVLLIAASLSTPLLSGGLRLLRNAEVVAWWCNNLCAIYPTALHAGIGFVGGA